MRTSLLARALVAVTVPSVIVSAAAILPSRAAPVRLHLAGAAAEVQPAPSPPPTAAAPERPVGEFAGVRYGPQASELLDLDLPERSGHSGPAPVIVYLHSGGWVAGGRANVNDAAAAQVARGFAVASVDYRLATSGGGASFPGAVFDVKRAIRFLKVDAAEWGLDPSRVIVMGASAGGHLAALVGASAGQLEPDVAGPLAAVDSSVTAVVDLVGITDLTTFATTAHPWAAPLTAAFLGCPLVAGRALCPPELLRRASVAPYVTGAAPPIFMAYGGDDTLVVPATQGDPLAAIWAHAHAGDPRSVTYEVVAGAGHNLSASQLDMAALDEFLDSALARASSSRATAP